MPFSATEPDSLPAEPEEAGTLPLRAAPVAGHVAPRCPHFGPCGGCQLQNLPYPAQLAQKQHFLLGLLADLPLPLPLLQTHTADPWQYRNRIRLRLEPDATSPLIFLPGYNRAQTNDFLPISTCPISAPILLHAAQTLTSLSSSDPNAALWLASTAQLEVFTTPDQSSLQLQLFLRHRPRISDLAGSLASLFHTLQGRLPQLVGIGAEALTPSRANSSTARPDRTLARLPALTAGRTGLVYPVPLSSASAEAAGLWVSRPSFFQINRHLLPDLLHTALAAADLPMAPRRLDLAWDLFAGVGLFARALAPSFNRVVAVETAPSAVADLRAARVPNIELVDATVLEFLRQSSISRDRPDLVLLDPPRAGLGLEGASLLCRLRPPRVVYVSCDPTTLARDLRAMLSSRYILAELHMVDMFPQTAHLETVAVLVHEDTAARTGTASSLSSPA